MHKSEIREGNTIITKPVKNKTVIGVVMSTRGTKRCSVRDEQGTLWNVPYPLIIACSQDVQAVEVVKAKVGDILQFDNGARFQVDKVNRARYSVTRLSDGAPRSISFSASFTIVGSK